jgi:hypothetical protein
VGSPDLCRGVFQTTMHFDIASQPWIEVHRADPRVHIGAAVLSMAANGDTLATLKLPDDDDQVLAILRSMTPDWTGCVLTIPNKMQNGRTWVDAADVVYRVVSRCQHGDWLAERE